MSFIVSARVPIMYRWDGIEHGLGIALADQGIDLSRELLEHYAWLLQVTSWSYGVDWNPVEDRMSLSLPFEGPLQNMSTTQDDHDYDDPAGSLSRDKISSILMQTLEKVPIRRLVAHFHRG